VRLKAARAIANALLGCLALSCLNDRDLAWSLRVPADSEWNQPSLSSPMRNVSAASISKSKAAHLKVTRNSLNRGMQISLSAGTH